MEYLKKVPLVALRFKGTEDLKHECTKHPFMKVLNSQLDAKTITNFYTQGLNNILHERTKEHFA